MEREDVGEAEDGNVISEDRRLLTLLTLNHQRIQVTTYTTNMGTMYGALNRSIVSSSYCYGEYM